jgi:hypothetical protein
MRGSHDCYPDGHTELLAVPWAEPRSRFTTFFETWAVQVLQAAQASARPVCLCGWIGAPRTASGSAPSSEDCSTGTEPRSVLSDFAIGRVLEVVEGWDESSGAALWQSLPEAQRAHVEAAAMDILRGLPPPRRRSAAGRDRA